MTMMEPGGTARPERERGQGRRVFVPIVFMIGLVVAVALIVFLIAQPWESEGETGDPNQVATPTVTR